MLELNLLGENITIEKQDYGAASTITLKSEGLNLEIHIDKSNLDYLRQKLNPEGLIPDSLDMKMDMLNQIAEDIGPIYDKEQPSYYISKYTYDREKDNVYYESEEEI
jgi:hypothetical protein